MAREDSQRLGIARPTTDEREVVEVVPRASTDEGKAAHDWITRIAAIVGVVVAIAAAGFTAAQFFGRYATRDELDEVRAVTVPLAATSAQHEARIGTMELAIDRIARNQQQINAKLDWLVQVQLLTASRSRVALPPPPTFREEPRP